MNGTFKAELSDIEIITHETRTTSENQNAISAVVKNVDELYDRTNLEERTGLSAEEAKKQGLTGRLEERNGQLNLYAEIKSGKLSNRATISLEKEEEKNLLSTVMQEIRQIKDRPEVDFGKCRLEPLQNKYIPKEDKGKDKILSIKASLSDAEKLYSRTDYAKETGKDFEKAVRRINDIVVYDKEDGLGILTKQGRLSVPTTEKERKPLDDYLNLKSYNLSFQYNKNGETRNDSISVMVTEPAKIVQELKRLADTDRNGSFHRRDYNFSDIDLSSFEVRYNNYRDELDIAELKISEAIAKIEAEKTEPHISIDFTDTVNEEVLVDGKINTLLSLNEEDCKEIYRRGEFSETFGMTYDDFKDNYDCQMNVYAMEDKDDIKLYATCSCEEIHKRIHKDEYISLSSEEHDSLTEEVCRAIEAKIEQEYLKENENADIEYGD